LKITAGTTNSIVGYTGKSKNCLFNMLLKNSKPEHGEVFIDGQNLNNVSKSSVQKNLSVAQKNGLLFNHLTIYENLIYENP